jgi:hypothetical protein
MNWWKKDRFVIANAKRIIRISWLNKIAMISDSWMRSYPKCPSPTFPVIAVAIGGSSERKTCPKGALTQNATLPIGIERE